MKKSVVVIAIIAILVIAGGYFLLKGKSPTGSVVVENTESAKIIYIKATRFQYDPGTITVKKGDRIKIVVENIDTKHGILIPGLNVSGVDSLEFLADKAGTYEFRCPIMCGSGHRAMKGTLIVEE